MTCFRAQLHNTHHAAAKVQEAAEGALKDLQLGYLDLWLMHWPVTGNKGPSIEPPIKETWQVRLDVLSLLGSPCRLSLAFICCLVRNLLQGVTAVLPEQVINVADTD